MLYGLYKPQSNCYKVFALTFLYLLKLNQLGSIRIRTWKHPTWVRLSSFKINFWETFRALCCSIKGPGLGIGRQDLRSAPQHRSSASWAGRFSHWWVFSAKRRIWPTWLLRPFPALSVSDVSSSNKLSELGRTPIGKDNQPRLLAEGWRGSRLKENLKTIKKNWYNWSFTQVINSHGAHAISILIPPTFLHSNPLLSSTLLGLLPQPCRWLAAWLPTWPRSRSHEQGLPRVPASHLASPAPAPTERWLSSCFGE